ncbi:hypothetical protein [Legionella sp. km772]|uniref:hypothetical protein n=1 Tax=Legionella sp. km772 TaxID=2498111 RepID=UPI000F8C3D39|nr:hypothetical protein [Legionella sp. km772]RUR04031.1 hypothetical protein ELY15_15945 [Legionella sp. km772]
MKRKADELSEEPSTTECQPVAKKQKMLPIVLQQAITNLQLKRYEKAALFLNADPDLTMQIIDGLALMPNSLPFISYLHHNQKRNLEHQALLDKILLNENFSAYLSGKEVSSSLKCSLEQYTDSRAQLSTEEIMVYLMDALAKNYYQIIPALWANQTVIAYLKGEQTVISIRTKEGTIEEHHCTLSPEQWATYFKMIVFSQHPLLLKEMEASFYTRFSALNNQQIKNKLVEAIEQHRSDNNEFYLEIAFSYYLSIKKFNAAHLLLINSHSNFLLKIAESFLNYSCYAHKLVV